MRGRRNVTERAAGGGVGGQQERRGTNVKGQGASTTNVAATCGSRMLLRWLTQLRVARKRRGEKKDEGWWGGRGVGWDRVGRGVTVRGGNLGKGWGGKG